MVTYTPPRVISRAPNVVEPKGKGTVVVQVLVNANGTFRVMRVLHSTNPGDDAAALDIAKRSKYAPAIRNGKPASNFFDFSIVFGQNVVSGAAGQIDALLHQSRWADAKAAATAALAQNANDPLVQAQLGVADAFLHDISGAVGAFDRAGTVPKQYADVAMQAYSLSAESIAGTNPKTALAQAQKAVSLGGDYGAYYALALAQRAGGNDAAAQTALEKAKMLAQNAKPPADTGTLVKIDEQLLSFATARGDAAAVASLTSEIQHIDPGMGAKLAAYTDDQQAAVLQKRGDLQGAIKFLDQAASADPQWAGAPEYTKAAILYASLSVPNYVSARSEADKAISADANYALAYYIAGVALADNARVTGNDDQMQDANIYLNKAADLAKKQGLSQLAQAASYFERNHNADANLQFWSTQITEKSAAPLPGPSHAN